MNPVEFTHAVLISRVAPGQWHALEDDLVVGRGEASRRPDGRMFVSIDAWHGAAFDRLAEAIWRLCGGLCARWSTRPTST